MKISANNKIIPLIFSVIVILGFTYFVIQNIDEYERIFSFSLSRLLFLIGTILVTIFLNGIINYLIYGGLGINLKVKTSIGLAVVNTMANLLPFAGGLVAKGIYLNRKHNLQYSRYTSSMGALFICFISTNGFIGLIGLLFLTIFQSKQIPLIIIIGFGLMAGTIFLLWIPLKFGFLPDKWQNQMTLFNDGWQIFRKNRILLVKLVTIQIASVFAMALRFWIGFRFLSLEISYLDGILFSSATILTRLVSIAPGGLGIREAIIAIVGSFIGYDPAISAVAVGIDRLVNTTSIILLGTYFIYDLSFDVLD
jgi:uncharacterized membrane protein YbhN (UPF0104 family)